MKYTKKRSIDKKELSKGIRKVRSLINKHTNNEDYISAYLLQISLLEDRLRVMYYLHCSIREHEVDFNTIPTLGKLVNRIEEETSLLHVYGKDEKIYLKRLTFTYSMRNALVHQLISNTDSILKTDIIQVDQLIHKVSSIIRELKKEYYKET
jgi:hypothetical protein